MTGDRGTTLLDAVLVTSHDHKSLHHPQAGNPFFPWWDVSRVACVLCLAVMRERGEDIALTFAQKIPHQLAYEHDRAWWANAYLVALRFVNDPYDRSYLRECLAAAIRQGRTQIRESLVTTEATS